MPVNLTFAGKAYEDNNLLRYAFAFEQATKHRVAPPLVPELDSDFISKSVPHYRSETCARTHLPRLHVVVQSKEISNSNVHLEIQGTLQISGDSKLERISCYVNGICTDVKVEAERWSLATTYPASPRDSTWSRWTSPASKQTIIVLVAYTDDGLANGKLLLL